MTAKKTPEQKSAGKGKGGDLGASEVQKIVDKEQEQGFVGQKVDPTPNENYTLAGVTSGAPTPETDVDAAREARNASGVGLSGLEQQQRTNDAAKKKQQ